MSFPVTSDLSQGCPQSPAIRRSHAECHRLFCSTLTRQYLAARASSLSELKSAPLGEREFWWPSPCFSEPGGSVVGEKRKKEDGRGEAGGRQEWTQRLGLGFLNLLVRHLYYCLFSFPFSEKASVIFGSLVVEQEFPTWTMAAPT